MIVSINYFHAGQSVVRCFRIDAHGELVPSECLDVPSQPTAEHLNLPGAGDAVAAATSAVGVKPCGGCLRRKRWLNRITPGWLRQGMDYARRWLAPALRWRA